MRVAKAATQEAAEIFSNIRKINVVHNICKTPTSSRAERWTLNPVNCINDAATISRPGNNGLTGRRELAVNK
jgi:hypothetical protein